MQLLKAFMCMTVATDGGGYGRPVTIGIVPPVLTVAMFMRMASMLTLVPMPSVLRCGLVLLDKEWNVWYILYEVIIDKE